jgi:hypothetical protein
VEDEVHFLFQCPQCNLLRNEYDIPFINIYHFNKINLNIFVVQNRRNIYYKICIYDCCSVLFYIHVIPILACKFIKEAMFLENIHQSTKINLHTALPFTISCHLLLLLLLLSEKGLGGSVS